MRRELFRFALIGAAGFGVDTAALYAALGLGLGLYTGRIVSYLVAATFTWAMNRRYTFTRAVPSDPFEQWLKFLAANAVGALVNYGTYAALVTFVAGVRDWPVLGVAAGSIAGLGFNFTVSRGWVFRSEADQDEKRRWSRYS